MRCSLSKITLTAVALVLFAVPASADSITDPVGDFLPTFAGPNGPDLDVVSANVTLQGSRFVFSGIMDGAIGTTTGGFYVWGVDRGAGTASFAPNGLPDIKFDSVVIVFNDGTGFVRDIPGGVNSPLTAADILISGNSVQAYVSLSMLQPSLGFTPDQYAWNLWPRCCGSVGGFEQISDFAPDTTNAQVQVVPEPATMLLLGTGLAGIGAMMRKRRQAQGK